MMIVRALLIKEAIVGRIQEKLNIAINTNKILDNQVKKSTLMKIRKTSLTFKALINNKSNKNSHSYRKNRLCYLQMKGLTTMNFQSLANYNNQQENQW